MNILEIILGQVPEAMYFAVFMILVKGLKTRRFTFIISMIIEYLLILNVLPYSIWSYVLYFILSFLLLKILYKDKSNVTDIFTMGIASIGLVITSALSYFITLGNMIRCTIVNRIILFVMLYVFRHKLCHINKLYNRLWNRGKHSYKMKSTTFRALNLVIFNLSFVIINLGVIVYYCGR